MTETKAKNPDFTLSAVNLTNSQELGDMLLVRRQKSGDVKEMEDILHMTDEWKALEAIVADVDELDAQIREAIDRLGGFQSIEDGLYGLRQRRVSLTYVAKLVRTILPNFAEALIEEVVNKKKMEGLLKGDLVTQEQAEACADRDETLAYIIKT